MPTWEPLSSLFQRTPLKGWQDVHPMFGDRFFDLDGNRIERGQQFNPAAARLPAVISNAKTVVGDLIPSSSWGSSLANLLTKKSWDGLRLPLIQTNHNICELCGHRFGTLDAHEIWTYHFPPEHEWEQRNSAWIFGTQKLEGLMAICSPCHRCFHLGKADVDGVLDRTLNRLAALNCWHGTTIERYRDTLSARYDLTNQICWALDLSWVRHPDGGITVRRPWKSHEEDARLLTAPNKFTGESVTALLEVPWKFVGEQGWRGPEKAETPDHAPVLAATPEKRVMSTPRPAWGGKYDELTRLTPRS
jgi:hypothetical protein